MSSKLGRDQDGTEHIRYEPVCSCDGTAFPYALTQLAQGVNKAFCFWCVDTRSTLWSKELNTPNTSDKLQNVWLLLYCLEATDSQCRKKA